MTPPCVLLWISLLMRHTVAVTDAIATPSCDIRDYGAVGDNQTINTNAIRAAIRDCHTRHNTSSSVEITIADGIYTTGSFNLTSNTVLHLNDNATLAGSVDPGDYGLCDCLPPCGTPMYCPLIGAFNASNISIIGHADFANHDAWSAKSNIDGRGLPWWRNFSDGLLQHQRPKLIEFAHCQHIAIANVTVFNSSFWTIHPIFSDFVDIADVNVFAPRSVGNTDGIDPNSARHVSVRNVYIDVGDDALAIKAAKGHATQHVLIENAIIKSRNFGIGSDVSGGISDVTLRNSRIGDQEDSSPSSF